MKTLYLHVGWSKTGTSAIQYQLNKKSDELAKLGICYSQRLQMNDQAHHHFALAFKPIHGYPAKYTVEEVLTIADEEMEDTSCDSLLISSELSTFYFNNPSFKSWVKRFDQVKVIATVRQQSDVMLSLFNQLIKDPQVRYKGTFFQLVLSNMPVFNYFNHLNQWASCVGPDAIKIIKYHSGVVDSFLALFGLTAEETGDIVNSSLPTDLLLLIQDKTRGISTPHDYRVIRDQLISSYSSSDEFQALPKRQLVSKGELDALDSFFFFPNKMLERKFNNEELLFEKKENKDIFVY